MKVYVAAKNMIDSFRFKGPYSITSHGSEANGLDWENGYITSHDLYMVVSEAVGGFAHLYFYGVMKCKLLTELLGHPILNLLDFDCPELTSFHNTRCCSLPCHKFPNVVCANKTAHSFYDWLMFHLQT